MDCTCAIYWHICQGSIHHQNRNKNESSSLGHFDIIAPEEMKDTAVIYGYGKEYLKTKGQEGQPLTSKECRFCHVETVRPQWEAEIKQKGYFIIEMENCK
ncbi:MAG: DUF2024 family protein [Flavobacterium sp.]